jgi:hypothetical protein
LRGAFAKILRGVLAAFVLLATAPAHSPLDSRAHSGV